MKKFLTTMLIGLSLSVPRFLSAQSSQPICDATFKEDFSPYVEPAIYPPGFFHYFIANGIGSFTWDFGDSTSLEYGSSAKHHFKKDGVYKVTLKVQKKYPVPLNNGMADALCTDSSIQYITIGQCDASFNASDSYLKTYPARYSRTTLEAVQKGNDGYSWDFGDGSPRDSGAIVNHTFPKPGKYYVTLGIYSLAKDSLQTPCKSFKGDWIMVGGTVVSDSVIVGNCQTYITPQINGTSVTFRDLLVIDYFDNAYQEQYEWDFGDGTFGTGRNISHIYGAPGKYSAILKKKLYHNPCIDFVKSGFPCTQPIQLLCSSEQTFSIDLGNTKFCPAYIGYSTKNLKVDFKQPFLLFDSVALYDSVNIYKVPDSTFKWKNLQDSLIRIDYVWDFGDGMVDTSNVYEVSHQYANAGTYRVKLTITYVYPPNWIDPRRYIQAPCGYYYGETDITVTDSQTKTCQALFDWTINGTELKLKTKNTGSQIGYTKLDFGDGNWVETNGSSMASSHTYQVSGNYEVCLKVASVPDSVLILSYLPNYCSDTYCQSITTGKPTVSITGLGQSSTVKTSVSAYPNPAQDKVKFFISEGTNNMDLRIYDATGTLQKEVKGLANQDFELAIPDLASGIYVYSLSNSSGVLSKGKLVVSK